MGLGSFAEMLSKKQKKSREPRTRRGISIICLCYDMQREIPRTLQSMSPEYQRTSPEDFEVILFENPSPNLLSPKLTASFSPNVLYRLADKGLPLTAAMNRAVQLAQYDHLLLCVDGARILSARVLEFCRLALSIDPAAVVAFHGMHLGLRPQQQALSEGVHSKELEDEFLEEIGFPQHSEALLTFSSWAGSSKGGWFSQMAESNCLFIPKELFYSIGGFDERLLLPAGGLANLDLYNRAIADQSRKLFFVLGEGTFHQHHGGDTTSSNENKFEIYKQDYLQATGRPFNISARTSFEFLGHIPMQALALAKSSIVSTIEAERCKRPPHIIKRIRQIEQESSLDKEFQHPLVLVIGMHRSGTSYVARQLANNGFAIPGTPLGGGGLSNPLGHFEPHEIVMLHNLFLFDQGQTWRSLGDLQWDKISTDYLQWRAHTILKLLDWGQAAEPPRHGYVIKDPRLCRLLPLWNLLSSRTKVRFRKLFVIRNPQSVAESLYQRDNINLDFGRLLWARYTHDLLVHVGPSDKVLIVEQGSESDIEDFIRSINRGASTQVEPLSRKPPRMVSDDPLSEIYRDFVKSRSLNTLRLALRGEIQLFSRYPEFTAHVDRLTGEVS